MSQEDDEVVRRFLAAVNRGDRDAVATTIHRTSSGIISFKDWASEAEALEAGGPSG
jgi:hypothetical protein